MVITKTKVLMAIVAALVMPCAISTPAADEPAATETARKSYNNDRFGFAFDYPAAWSLIEKPGSQSGAAMLSLKLLSPDENVPVRRDYSPGSVGIEVFANPARRPLREWLDEHGWPFDAAGRSVTPTSIGGLPALEVATGRMFAPNRFTYVASKMYVLRLSALAPDSQTVVQSIRFKP
jgi:hypothetical protein